MLIIYWIITSAFVPIFFGYLEEKITLAHVFVGMVFGWLITPVVIVLFGAMASVNIVLWEKNHDK